MTIVVRDVEWGQSECNLYVKVPLNGVSPSRADIMYTKSYLKVNYPPYLYECLLYEEISDDESKAVIKDGQVTFNLRKITNSMWSSLHSQEQNDKQLFITRKREQLEYYQRKLEETKEHNDKQAYDRKQMSVKAAISLDSDNIRKIENRKESERKQIAERLEKMKDRTPLIPKEKKISKNVAKEEHPIRDFKKIPMSFTPRYFPTPSRESTAADEEEWLKKQELNYKISSKKDDLDDSEINPVSMREKANKFFKNGDIDSAINAYSHTIDISPGMSSLYSNRGACYLKKKMYKECIDDCNKALELLTPPVEGNKNSRIKAYVRLGSAYLSVNDRQNALSNLENALLLDNTNEQLLKDVNILRNSV